MNVIVLYGMVLLLLVLSIYQFNLYLETSYALQERIHEMNENHRELQDINTILVDQLEEVKLLREQDQRVMDALAELLLHVKAETYEMSAYTLAGGDGDGVTSIGVAPTAGRTIAVDPNVIPYGSLVYVENYGWRIAEDTGGAINGRKLDLFVDTYTEAINIGRRKVKALVILKGER